MEQGVEGVVLGGEGELLECVSPLNVVINAELIAEPRHVSKVVREPVAVCPVISVRKSE